MKLIKAAVRSEKFDEVSLALQNIGIEYFMFKDGHRIDKADIHQVSYRGRTMNAAVSAEIVDIEMVIVDSDVQEAVACIKEAAYTGLPGDGKIFILPVDNTLDI